MKANNLITNPLTPPTPDPLMKTEKAFIKLESMPASSCGMLDRTRVALFAFMFAFVFINPLSYVIPHLEKGKINFYSIHVVKCSTQFAMQLFNTEIERISMYYVNFLCFRNVVCQHCKLW